MLLSDLQNKDIVNTVDGKNVGNIIDVNINSQTGMIDSLVIEPSKSFLSFFNRGTDTEIAWKHITKIGEDVILVQLNL